MAEKLPDLPPLPRRRSTKKSTKTKSSSTAPDTPDNSLVLGLAIGGGAFVVIGVLVTVALMFGRRAASPTANDVANGNLQPPAAAAAAAQAPQPPLVAKVTRIVTQEQFVMASGVTKQADGPGFIQGMGRLEILRDAAEGKAVAIDLELTRSDNTVPWPSFKVGAFWIGSESGETICLVLRDQLAPEVMVPNLTFNRDFGIHGLMIQGFGTLPEVDGLKKLMEPFLVPSNLVAVSDPSKKSNPAVQRSQGVRTIIKSTEYRDTRNSSRGKESYVVLDFGQVKCDVESPYGQLKFSGSTNTQTQLGDPQMHFGGGSLDFSGEYILKEPDGTTVEGQIRLDWHPFAINGSRLYRMVIGNLTVMHFDDVTFSFRYPDVSGVEDPGTSPPQASLQWEANGATAWYTTPLFVPKELPQENRLHLKLIAPRPAAPSTATLHVGDALTVSVELP